MELAPIVLFVYNRLQNTEILLQSLEKNALAAKSVLYVYADGPKADATAEDLEKINAVHELVRSRKWCGEVHFTVAEKNIGLAANIINGVTTIVNKYGKVIVLEDDLNLSPYFLSYMNDSLERYKENKEVGQIGACNYFACGPNYPETFFAPFADCWGWATWADRWAEYEFDAQKLFDALNQKGLMSKFNLNNNSDMEGMLKGQIAGQIVTWDIQWLAVCVLNNWLVLYPNPSVTQHLYFGNATHNTTNLTPPLMQKLPGFKTMPLLVLPEVLKAMELAYSGNGDYYGNRVKPVINSRYLKDKIKSVLRKIKR